MYFKFLCIYPHLILFAVCDVCVDENFLNLLPGAYLTGLLIIITSFIIVFL